MADTVGKVEDQIWPLPKFKFKVTFAVNKFELSFSKVTGLDAQAGIINYRHGDSKMNHVIKMPGLQTFNNVTLERGVFVGKNDFFDWFAQISANTIAKGRDTITISLLNEKDKPTMVWTLHEAWPTRVISTDMQSDANEAAIESLEIAFEYLEIVNENNV